MGDLTPEVYRVVLSCGCETTEPDETEVGTDYICPLHGDEEGAVEVALIGRNHTDGAAS